MCDTKLVLRIGLKTNMHFRVNDNIPGFFFFSKDVLVPHKCNATKFITCNLQKQNFGTLDQAVAHSCHHTIYCQKVVVSWTQTRGGFHQPAQGPTRGLQTGGRSESQTIARSRHCLQYVVIPKRKSETTKRMLSAVNVLNYISLPQQKVQKLPFVHTVLLSASFKEGKGPRDF